MDLLVRSLHAFSDWSSSIEDLTFFGGYCWSIDGVPVAPSAAWALEWIVDQLQRQCKEAGPLPGWFAFMRQEVGQSRMRSPSLACLLIGDLLQAGNSILQGHHRNFAHGPASLGSALRLTSVEGWRLMHKFTFSLGWPNPLIKICNSACRQVSGAGVLCESLVAYVRELVLWLTSRPVSWWTLPCINSVVYVT